MFCSWLRVAVIRIRFNIRWFFPRECLNIEHVDVLHEFWDNTMRISWVQGASSIDNDFLIARHINCSLGRILCAMWMKFSLENYLAIRREVPCGLQGSSFWYLQGWDSVDGFAYLHRRPSHTLLLSASLLLEIRNRYRRSICPPHP